MPAAPDRRLIALALPPGEEFATRLDEAWAAGDAVLPLDPLQPAAALDRQLRGLRPHLLVDASGRRTLPDAAPVDDGVALVIVTSGSTGEPKGAQLSRSALAASAGATADRIGAAPADRWLACLPWHHIGGLQVLLRARLTGTPVTVLPRFDVAEVAAARDATLVSLVPVMLARLLDAGVDLTGFRVILLGGAAAPPALLDRAAEHGARVVTTYGMSETAGGCVYDGVPLDGAVVRIADGRIHLGGPMLFSGYRLRPDLTAAALVDGWLHTLDLGRIVDGRLEVLGRADDVIVTGGENVVATDVAALLVEHPAIADVAVTGVDDEHWGQRVVAVVVPVGGAPSLADLRAWLSGRASAAAAPRQLVVVDDIPRLASGKPDRLALRRLAQAGTARTQSTSPPSLA